MSQKILKKSESVAVSAQEGLLQKHLKKVIIGSGLVLVTIIACSLFFVIMDKRNYKAAELLAPCEQYFQAGTLDKALNGDGQECVGFLAIIDQYGGTKIGNVAKLYAGLAYAQQNKMVEAKKYLEDFNTQDDEMISPAALMALGNVYVNTGEKEKGAQTLVKAAHKADNIVISPIALLQAGEVYESLSEKDKALELYQEIKANYPGSMQGGEIDKYIQRITLNK